MIGNQLWIHSKALISTTTYWDFSTYSSKSCVTLVPVYVRIVVTFNLMSLGYQEVTNCRYSSVQLNLLAIYAECDGFSSAGQNWYLLADYIPSPLGSWK